MRETTRQRCLVVALTLSLALPIGAQEPQTAGRSRPRNREEIIEAVRALDPQYRQWLQSVSGLITGIELDFFLDLEQDYRRDAFMESFWDVRDPDSRTPVNELRRRWQELVDSTAGGLPFGDARFLLFLLNGPPGRWSLPDGRPVGRCFSRSQELEIWFYGGSERTSQRFPVILLKRGSEVPYEVWHQGQALRAVQRSGGLPTTDISSLCADELLRYTINEVARMGSYDALLDEVMSPPIPSPEWLSSFSGSTTDLPDGASTFAVRSEITFPSRNQSRTGVQVLVKVPLDEAPGREFDGEPFHNFLLVGEIIRDEALFESFRYRFEGPIPAGAESIPLGFTRYLRPGPLTVRMLLHDVYGDRYAQIVREIDVPSPEGLPSAITPTTARLSDAVDSSLGPSLRLIPPPGSVHAGMVRFSTRTRGEFDEVTFYLDDKPAVTKRSRPYSVELDLGEVPAAIRVRVVGYRDGEEIATDQVWLNQGAQRFRVRMIEPRAGGVYPGSLTARIEVDTPNGQPPQRVELFLNDERVADLQSGPYTETLRLPENEVAVVRAVAYLEDGLSAEDAVIVNSAGFAEEIEVQLVELYVSVVDDRNRPVAGLPESAFQVFEDGVAQRLQRFEWNEDGALRAALLVDRSSSMAPHLPYVAGAASAFAAEALRSEADRVAVFSFAEDLTNDVVFTTSGSGIDRALAGLVAFGRTALYDSLLQTINSFEGLSGQNAIVLFTDGRDEASRFDAGTVIAAAQRGEVTIHCVGLASAFESKDDRQVLERIAAASGGQAIFVDALDDLGDVYRSLLTQLRARYLLAYQSTSVKPAGEPREIRVEVEGRGLEVRAPKGFIP